MFGNFYFGGYSEYRELKNSLTKLFQNVEIIEENNKLTVPCDGFTLSINEGGPGTMFASEDYNIELKFSCYIDIISSYSHWADELMVFIGKLINGNDGDCLLELNDKPILMRKNSVITVDDKKLNGSVEFPFHRLGLSYQVGDII
ncbi:hypothetical protein [Paenibacillus sp. LK1]|uniref:hypothetical protein n=1 Tax=Paenibacillus sp. LK1 TaxID=2053014 RepID=UPI000C18E85E|nr:hypothetical protein [Paenibacillus sp. LK1]PIH59292.1 hypothetical protein CS562_10315 [Paenibacillus sp. LK1]